MVNSAVSQLASLFEYESRKSYVYLGFEKSVPERCLGIVMDYSSRYAVDLLITRVAHPIFWEVGIASASILLPDRITNTLCLRSIRYGLLDRFVTQHFDLTSENFILKKFVDDNGLKSDLGVVTSALSQWISFYRVEKLPFQGPISPPILFLIFFLRCVAKAIIFSVLYFTGKRVF